MKWKKTWARVSDSKKKQFNIKIFNENDLIPTAVIKYIKILNACIIGKNVFFCGIL
jgi:hypothetical protein